MTYFLDLFDDIDLGDILSSTDVKYVAFALGVKAKAFHYVRDTVVIHTDVNSGSFTVSLKRDGFTTENVSFDYGLFHIDCRFTAYEDDLGEQHYIITNGSVTLRDTSTCKVYRRFLQ